MSKLYTRVPVKRFPKSTFSQSRPVAGSMSAQRLYCSNAKEVLPADDWRASSEAFVRVQPLVAPVLAKLSVHQEAFFVPCWQLNDHFEDFITRGERGTYNEKMPHIHVSTLYGFIDWLLHDWDEARLSLFGFIITDKALDLYRFIVDKIVRIIELSDWFRSVPFVLPEFLSVPSILEDPDYTFNISSNIGEIIDDASLDDLFSDALSSFQSLNGHLNGSNLIINLMPYFAALKVYCEFYRDENLVEDWWDAENNWKDISFKWTGDVSQEAIFTPADLDEHDWKLFFALFCVKNRAWSKDRFTSALPFVQKGPDVILPLSGTSPVLFDSPAQSTVPGPNVEATKYNGHVVLSVQDSLSTSKVISAYTDFSQASLATTIRDFRTANKLEEFYEADGIGGSRYPENTLVQWGERTPDARLPRAQFLGSFSQPVSIAEVLQTSSTDSTSPQGNLAGKATSYGRGFLFAKHFSMHGFLLFFTSIKTASIYEQGINPMFSRYDWTEYAWPRFAHLGEEPVYTKELAVNSDVAEDTVFGYAPRYSDYKTDQGSIHGQLKSTLNYWTMSRRFANTPALNEEFIYGDPRRDSFAVVNPFAEQFIVEIDYKIKSRRKLPFFGVPSL